MNLKYIVAAFIVSFVLFSCAKKQVSEKVIKETPTGKWELVWNDDFDYVGLPDSTKWSFDTDGNAWKWGNNEDQWYTNSEKNAFVSDGVLKIMAHKEDVGDNNKYSSARLRTLNKGDWKYGRIEVAAKLPTAVGTWSAIWMLPSDSIYGKWPHCGEIDIMEHVGRDPKTVFSTVHTGNFNHLNDTQVGDTIIIDDVTKFHTYALEWDEKELRSYVNDSLYFTFKQQAGGSESWPFDQSFHLLLNLAIGGNLGGPVDSLSFPQQMTVDYVNIYKKLEEEK